MLHGGRSQSTEPVRPWNIALARMRLLLPPLSAGPTEPRIAIGMVRNRYRGWNGEAADAAADACWAIEQITARYGRIPVVLAGHSMGGRAALRAAGHEAVVGVAALAPWVPDGEPVRHLAGRTLLIMHGDLDLMTSPAQSLLFADRARAAGAAVCRLRVEGSGHTMMRRMADWNLLPAGFARALLGVEPMPEPVAAQLAVREAAGGVDSAAVIDASGRTAPQNPDTTLDAAPETAPDLTLDTALDPGWRSARR